MNDSYVTLQGWVGGEVERRLAGDVPLATFRVGSTPRRLRDGAWVDGETQWFTVNCWRTLAANAAASLRKGDPVVVHGRVRVERWQRQDGTTGTGWVVEASFVGHDLNRGTSAFTRPVRPVEEQPAA